MRVEQIPYFNAPIFLENKTQIGKVDEILGQINTVVRATSPSLPSSRTHTPMHTPMRWLLA